MLLTSDSRHIGRLHQQWRTRKRFTENPQHFADQKKLHLWKTLVKNCGDSRAVVVMVSTATCYALFPLFFFHFLQSSFGLLHQRPQISRPYLKFKLHCTGSSPVSEPPQPGRSNMNEKMLERAKKLRDEALQLENLGSIADDATKSSTQSSREEFVSRFPIERLTANTSIFSLGAFTDSSRTNASSNGTYMSVLADRDVEKAQQKSKLDKISGESLRTKRAISSLIDELQSLSAPANKIDVPKSHSEDDSKAAKKDSQQSAVKTAQSKVGDMSFAMLDLVCDSDTKEMFEKTLVNVTDANGVVRYKLQSVSKYVSNFSWLEGAALRAISFLFLEAEHDGIKEDEDFKYLQMAFLSALADKTRMYADDLLEFTNTTDIPRLIGRENYQLRADYLKAVVTGQIPSVAGLMALLESRSFIDSTISEAPDEVYLWRTATLNRLQSQDPQFINERALLWNLLPATETEREITLSLMQPEAVITENEVGEVGSQSSLLDVQNDGLSAVQSDVSQNIFNLPTESVSSIEPEGNTDHSLLLLLCSFLNVLHFGSCLR